MQFYLGIDGGGTKTGFALCDCTGKVVAKAYFPSCHYLQHGLHAITTTINSGLNSVCELSGVNQTDITSCFISCGGYGDIQGDCKDIEKTIKMALFNIDFSVGNDCENALAGAFCGKAGINIVAGTGAIGAGINEKGEFMRSGGWHYAIGGDEGSGYWIATRLINEWFRQFDGRDKKTILFNRICSNFRVRTGSEMLSLLVNVWEPKRTAISSVAPLIKELYDEDDPYAKAILNSAAKELSKLAISINNRLRFYQPPNVSYSGGIFRLGYRILNPLRENLSEWGLKLIPPALSPECGSLILAMKAKSKVINNEIIDTLNKSFEMCQYVRNEVC